MKKETYLHILREADHQVASMPKGTERNILQESIGKKLDQLLKIQQVESTKSPSVEFVPRHVVLCCRHRGSAGSVGRLKAEFSVFLYQQKD